MKQTTNYNLVKPDLTDSPPDITAMNPNWDKIDEKLKEFEEENDNFVDNKADLVDGKVPSTQLPYIEVPVQSVNNKTGAVVLTKSDVGLGNADNTADSAKNVLSATKLKTARKINGVNFDGTSNITIEDGTKAPTNHKSTGIGYGVGDANNYGHCKTINNLTRTSFVSGEALSANQGKVLNDKINEHDEFIFSLSRTVTLTFNNRLIGGYSDDNPDGNPSFSIPITEIANADEVLFVLRGTITAVGVYRSENSKGSELGAGISNPDSRIEERKTVFIFDTYATGYRTINTRTDTISLNMKAKGYINNIILENNTAGKAIIFNPTTREMLFLSNKLSIIIGPGVGIGTTNMSRINGTLYLDIYTRRNM